MKRFSKNLRGILALSDKRGLSYKGHKYFALTFGFFIIYILKDFIPIQYPFLILHAPVFIAGTVFPDIIHKTGQGRIAHRLGFFHRKFTYQMLMIISPIIIFYAISNQKYYFLGIPFNKFTLIQSFIFGLLLHGLSDSWTSPLKL